MRYILAASTALFMIYRFPALLIFAGIFIAVFVPVSAVVAISFATIYLKEQYGYAVPLLLGLLAIGVGCAILNPREINTVPPIPAAQASSRILCVTADGQDSAIGAEAQRISVSGDKRYACFTKE